MAMSKVPACQRNSPLPFKKKKKKFAKETPKETPKKTPKETTKETHFFVQQLFLFSIQKKKKKKIWDFYRYFERSGRGCFNR